MTAIGTAIDRRHEPVPARVNGFDEARRTRVVAERATAMRPEMKVLFTSGYTDDAVLQHGILESDVAYVGKPITPGSLSRKVRAVLDAKS